MQHLKNKLCLGIVLIFILIQACQDGKRNTASKPNNLIEPNKMHEIISELHLVDAVLNQKSLAPDSAKKLSQDYYEFVYKKYNVNALDFNNSFKYYLNNPADMDSIYTKVLEDINMKGLNIKSLPNTIDTAKTPPTISVDTSMAPSTAKLNTTR